MTQMRRGLLELAVLTIIDSAMPTMRAGEIMEKLSKTEFHSPAGTLYFIFAELHKNKLVSYEYEEQDTSSPRRCYSLTKAGENLLKELRNYWYILDFWHGRLTPLHS